jgi:RNA polymerase sigma-70 factor (ECF subfamily)
MRIDEGPPAVVAHLFRHESGRITAALLRLLGPHNLDLAEDVVQDVLCRALETWKYGRLPDRPAAWLMQAARHRALDVIRHQRAVRKFAPELGQLLSTEWSLAPVVESVLTDEDHTVEQLRLTFALCHPQLGPEVQVTAILRWLCGFGPAEIAGAFLTSEAAIEKRLQRARALLAEAGLPDELGDQQLARRLDAVHAALYLLFSEGYHGAHPEMTVQEELCVEALRLARLLEARPVTATPATLALLALMCLLAARLPGRLDPSGRLLLLEAQDRSRWDRQLAALGLSYLERSASGPEISVYHLEAAIAAEHVRAPSLEATDWRAIVRYYDLLVGLAPTAIVALNRAIAVGQAEGAEAGLAALSVLAEADRARLEGYPFYFAARADLAARAGRPDQARADLQRAGGLARSPAEAALYRQKRDELPG